MATADNSTSMPVRTIGQNPYTECDRRAREAAGFEACLSTRATPFSHIENQPAFTLRLLASLCIRERVGRFQTTLKILCQLAVFSYALTRLSSEQNSCDARGILHDACVGFGPHFLRAH